MLAQSNCTLQLHTPTSHSNCTLQLHSICFRGCLFFARINQSGNTVVMLVRLAFADTQQFISDPDVVRVPTAELLSKDYAAERRCVKPGHRHSRSNSYKH